MEPLAVIKDFNPFKDGDSGFRPGGELAAMHHLAFEAAPEAFPGGVVLAVTRTAHAREDACGDPPLPVSFPGVLAAAIRMMPQPCRWPTWL